MKKELKVKLIEIAIKSLIKNKKTTKQEWIRKDNPYRDNTIIQDDYDQEWQNLYPDGVGRKRRF